MAAVFQTENAAKSGNEDSLTETKEVGPWGGQVAIEPIVEGHSTHG